jgi:formyl-CoA transferase
MSQRPLDGIRVIELGSLIAGPFAGKTLGDFGAEVIKVEPPRQGDPLRSWRTEDGTTSMWWHVQARNKKSVAIDLRKPEGQEAVRQLILGADVVIENFRPGTMEKWGLGYESLSKENPGLIMLRISGYGQTGPMRDLTGYGVVAEAMGGFRYITGEPGRAPVRPGISIGDSLSALHGVIGIMMALYHRTAHSGKGQVIDVALYESVFNMMEGAVPEYDRLGINREPAGSALQGVSPTNAYPSKDGSYFLIAGNGDSIFPRLMALIGRPDLGSDPVLARNPGRVIHMARIDEAIAQWSSQRTIDEALAELAEVGVPSGRIFTVKDILEDPQYRARDMIREVSLDDGTSVKVPGVVPKLSATPGTFEGGGPRLGQHTEQVLRDAGFDDSHIERLKALEII